jgi:hypothetical protein
MADFHTRAPLSFPRKRESSCLGERGQEKRSCIPAFAGMTD